MQCVMISSNYLILLTLFNFLTVNQYCSFQEHNFLQSVTWIFFCDVVTQVDTTQ